MSHNGACRITSPTVVCLPCCIRRLEKKVPRKNVWARTDWFDGGCAPARFVNITLTSILRRVLPLKGFCYRWARWEEFSQGVIEIGIEARERGAGAAKSRRRFTTHAASRDAGALFRCGRSPYFWFIGHGAWTVRAAECMSNTCPGPAANCNSATPCAFSLPSGRGCFPGRRWLPLSASPGPMCTPRSNGWCVGDCGTVL